MCECEWVKSEWTSPILGVLLLMRCPVWWLEFDPRPVQPDRRPRLLQCSRTSILAIVLNGLRWLTWWWTTAEENIYVLIPRLGHVKCVAGNIWTDWNWSLRDSSRFSLSLLIYIYLSFSMSTFPVNSAKSIRNYSNVSINKMSYPCFRQVFIKIKSFHQYVRVVDF